MSESQPGPAPHEPERPAAAGRRTNRGDTRTRRARVRGIRATPRWLVTLFLFPALVLLGALVVYPIGYSLVRSLLDADGSHFVGLDNYQTLFTTHSILTAIRNNAIWVVVAPVLATGLGLVFAVLTERVRWGTAFKLIIFMPMAISMLAAGIIFRLVYEQEPERGAANAVVTAIHDTFGDDAAYPGATALPTSGMKKLRHGGFTTKRAVAADRSTPVKLPLVGVRPEYLPAHPDPVRKPHCQQGLCGVVWFDFVRGTGGTPNKIEPGEKALPRVTVQAVNRHGTVLASTETDSHGRFTLFSDDAPHGGVHLRLPASNFAAPYNGVDWLGPSLITPAIIGAYIWMWAGFAMVLISAGLAGIPRELLDAARVDGANEWQVFRRVTVPVLTPVLAVVTVTLMINVLKIFDLVWIIAPGPTQQDANVLALQLYLSSFGGGKDQGLGSAISVLLLLLVIPVMWFNIRRFRKERS